jgi:hypothetical protein
MSVPLGWLLFCLAVGTMLAVILGACQMPLR